MIQANYVRCLLSLPMCCLMLASLAPLRAEEKPDPGITLADGKITLKTPKEWKRKPPKTKIVDHEFETPAVEGDKIAGRITVMGAGGSIEDNIARWIGQFSQPDGKATKNKAATPKVKIAGQEVHYVDLSGNYKDQAGPFTPAVMREDYRMLGAIIVTEGLGNYFIKYYGPKATVTANEKLFQEVVNSLKVK